MSARGQANDFAALPVKGSKLLVPITSWEEMRRETAAEIIDTVNAVIA